MLLRRFVHRSKMIMIFRFDCCFAKDLIQLVVTTLKFFCLKVDWGQSVYPHFHFQE